MTKIEIKEEIFKPIYNDLKIVIGYTLTILPEDKQQILQDHEDAKKYNAKWKEVEELENDPNIESITMSYAEVKQAPKDRQIVKEIKKIIEMNKNHYDVLKRQNPKLADEYLDVVKFCNHLLRILEGKK